MTDILLRALAIARDALDLPAGERGAFITARCGGDDALRENAASMLEEIGPSGDEREPPRAASDDALLHTRLGPFRLVERIGRGGMGVVYRGSREGEDFAQDVAVKLVRRGFDFDDVHARFLRERRILARLDHPNLARFIDGGVAPDGRPWFALEYVRGTSLVRWCDEHRLSLRERVRLFLEVCAAVQHAHAQLVVHRDLKPANILVDGDGHVRLLDFGIARLLEGEDEAGTTIAGRYAFTPEYAAPEQFGGESAGVATDVYALGVILYELLSGTLPYALDRHDLVAAERVVRASPPLPLAGAIAREGDAQQRLEARSTTLRGYRAQTHGDLSRILDKALSKEPLRRYASVEAFADDLQRWLAGAPVRVSGNGLAYRLGKFLARNRVAVGFAATLAAALVATTLWALYNAHVAQVQREAAEAETGRANAVREYVMLMFRDAAERSDAEKLTARDVLRQGARRLFEQFKDDPRTGNATALMLGELYSQLADTEGATPLLERLLRSPGIDAQPELLANARYDLAQIDYYANRRERAQTLLAQAQAFWSGDAARYADRLSESRTLQAQLERSAGRLDAAIATLQAGIAQRRALKPGADRETATALSTLSIALLQAGQADAALARAGEARTMFDQIGLGDSMSGLGALNNRAQIEAALGRWDDAARDFGVVVEHNRALFGPSQNLGVAENNLALCYRRLHRDADALPLLEDALALATRYGGERGLSSMMPRANLAETYAANGRAEQALPLAEASVEIAAKDYADNAVFAGVAHRARAAVRIARGDRAGAQADLDAAQANFARLGAGGARYLASLDELRAKLAAGR